ncbi:hypothetical protein TNCV_1839261 [Trichonephila clavipes]|nr:hypothetical protein TNCV_1839261 [Trichonephila clavipes]
MDVCKCVVPSRHGSTLNCLRAASPLVRLEEAEERNCNCIDDLFQQVSFYHEHVLVKEPGTDKETPWHHDQSYYPIDGEKAKRDRNQISVNIAQQLLTANGRQVSRFTLTRCLHKCGLFAHHPEFCIPYRVDDSAYPPGISAVEELLES